MRTREDLLGTIFSRMSTSSAALTIEEGIFTDSIRFEVFLLQELVYYHLVESVKEETKALLIFLMTSLPFLYLFICEAF